MDTLVRTEGYRGYTIEIHQDFDPINPREWDTLGTIVHWHRRYDLGEEKLSHEQARQIDRNGGFYKWLRRERDAEVILPLTFLDHSVQSIRVGSGAWGCDPGGWDSGTVGFVYASRNKIMENFNRERMSKKLREQVEEYLRAEIETYDAYMTGDVYGYVILDPYGNNIDSCWGFYGWDESRDYMFNDYIHPVIDHDIKKRAQAHAERVKGWIRNEVPLMYREPFELNSVCAQL